MKWKPQTAYSNAIQHIRERKKENKTIFISQFLLSIAAKSSDSMSVCASFLQINICEMYFVSFYPMYERIIFTV